MSVKTSFIGELKSESVNTRRMLERVPLDNAGWKPHEKSTTIGRLATHIAEATHWIEVILEADEFDFATRQYRPRVAASMAELLEIFDQNIRKAVDALENATDAEFEKTWFVKMGDKVVSSAPKKAAIRGWGISHFIHHRGQLSVYLRLLGIPVPGMYGPTADER
jgi:uncharacterized damage-inducible protein DinB